MKNRDLDLTPDEREECIIEYVDEFRNGTGGALAEYYCRMCLDKIGMDRDEIDYLIRTNRP
jgi:hypothetical protein